MLAKKERRAELRQDLPSGCGLSDGADLLGRRLVQQSFNVREPLEAQPTIESAVYAEVEKKLFGRKSGNAFPAQLGPSLSGLSKRGIGGELWIAKEAPVEIDGSPVVRVIVGKIFLMGGVGAHAPWSEPPLRLRSKIAGGAKNPVCFVNLRFVDEQIDIPRIAQGGVSKRGESQRSALQDAKADLFFVEEASEAYQLRDALETDARVFNRARFEGSRRLLRQMVRRARLKVAVSQRDDLMMMNDPEQMGPVERPPRKIPDARGIGWFQGPANASQDKIELRGMNAFARKHILFTS